MLAGDLLHRHLLDNHQPLSGSKLNPYWNWVPYGNRIVLTHHLILCIQQHGPCLLSVLENLNSIDVKRGLGIPSVPCLTDLE